jgi:hypothetical protein
MASAIVALPTDDAMAGGRMADWKLSSLATLVATAIAVHAGAAAAACLPEKPDIAVHGIDMGDPLSAALQLGTGYDMIEGEGGLSYVVFTNIAETEVLKLYRNPGDAASVFNIAEVLAIDELESDEEATVLDTPRFRTGRGVHLGMSRAELFALFGACPRLAESEAPIDLYRYELTDVAASDLLKAHNMPLYAAEYAFKDGKLVRFLFGFSYP